MLGPLAVGRVGWEAAVTRVPWESLQSNSNKPLRPEVGRRDQQDFQEEARSPRGFWRRGAWGTGEKASRREPRPVPGPEQDGQLAGQARQEASL